MNFPGKSGGRHCIRDLCGHGAILGTAFRADLTITFAFEKLGSILWPGNEYAGRIIVCDIGITKESWLGEPPAVMALEEKIFDTAKKKAILIRAVMENSC